MKVLSPVAGSAVPITAVDDPVFAEAMVGPGVAVRPAGGWQDAVAPIDGTVATLHPHAFVVTADDGRGVLVHLGIDTVKREGAGFTVHVAKGDAVRAGSPMVGWDPDAVAAAGYSAVVPVVALDAPTEALSEQHSTGAVSQGEPLFSWASRH